MIGVADERGLIDLPPKPLPTLRPVKLFSCGVSKKLTEREKLKRAQRANILRTEANIAKHVDRIRVACQCSQCVESGCRWPVGMVGVVSIIEQHKVVRRFECSYECYVALKELNYVRADDEKTPRLTDDDVVELKDLKDKYGWERAEVYGVRPAMMELPNAGRESDDPVAVRSLKRVMRTTDYEQFHFKQTRQRVLLSVLADLRLDEPALAIRDVRRKLLGTIWLLKSAAFDLYCMNAEQSHFLSKTLS